MYYLNACMCGFTGRHILIISRRESGCGGMFMLGRSRLFTFKYCLACSILRRCRKLTNEYNCANKWRSFRFITANDFQKLVVPHLLCTFSFSEENMYVSIDIVFENVFNCVNKCFCPVLHFGGTLV